MKKYYVGRCTLPLEKYVAGSTDKAICVTVSGGYTPIHDTKLWIPKSILKIGEANEYGNADVYLPVWFIAKNGNYRTLERIVEIDFNANKIVEF